jgi:hypothetical protein
VAVIRRATAVEAARGRLLLDALVWPALTTGAERRCSDLPLG